MTLVSFSVFLSSLGKFWQSKKNALFLRWNIIILAFQFIYLSLRYKDLPSVIPLYFSKPWGEPWLAPAFHIFLLPFLSLLFALTNHIMALFIHQKKEILSTILIAFSLLYSLFSAIALFKIINLVI